MPHELPYSTGKVYTHVLPAEVYVTGVLPVAVVGAEPAECRVTCFTVLGLTFTKYAGGSLGPLSRQSDPQILGSAKERGSER
jgi:hypothetical protein